MALPALIFILSFLGSLQATPAMETEIPEVQHILFAMHSGDVETSLDLYQKYRQVTGKHDLELIQQLGLILLDRGFRSSDNEAQILTLFGAGIANHERCLYILEDALTNSNPQVQLIALHMLARCHNERADDAINHLLGSPHLIIRLEALDLLAEKKHFKVVGQLEALLAKVDEDLHPLFAPLFAKVGDAQATRALKKLLVSPYEDVRVSAILSTAQEERDDLLPQIRKLAAHHELAQQEACAVAAGVLRDETLIPRLKSIATSNTPTLRLAALQSLYQLGHKETRTAVEQLAKENNPFAIRILGNMKGSEPTLALLTTSPNLQTRINASLALLKLRDPRALPTLTEILIRDPRDLIFTKMNSLSSALTYWKAIPSGTQNFEDAPAVHELSLQMRENALALALELPARNFISLADLLFEKHQFDLIPTLVELLQIMQTPEAVQLLKKHQQKAGAPLIRNYCNLALYKLKEPGPYAENLRTWITGQQNGILISFRPPIPHHKRSTTDDFALNPDETSRLLISAFEAFAQTQDDKGLDILLEALHHGNPKNRYALAGLLLRSTL